MRWLLAAIAMAFVPALAQVPETSKQYLPMLVAAQRQVWPDAPMPEFMAAQIEKESCITLKHSKCWNPTAQLKTSREWGRGLGQITTAYNPDGSIRFDKQAELRARHASLREWTTERWADPRFQLLAIVEMNKGIFNRQRGAATVEDRLSFTLSAYNGGEGGLLQDRRLCANSTGCDQSRWFGHVEHHSMKQKVPKKGYGKSFFHINREYVRTILMERRFKYQQYF